ncbi:uncharacterized protein LOC121926631 [Sceloporus undulatus]|uniref:uncharacterized protein LOC121926631 n=1 Tax=Sceloporus undulatus TaxID=8520 RepID=UPI001C4DB4BB|nr:uncharacterized protein LOC121926631 [Sceloporus undulatus]
MESGGSSSSAWKGGSPLGSRTFRLVLLRRLRPRREGSLAAALAQAMALAVTGTAGAYPSWVLVTRGEGHPEPGELVLGAAWAFTRDDPAPEAPLLGSAGGPLMLAMAACCLLAVLSGSAALALDFLGQRRWRLLAPLLHGLTAVLIACAAALGSCLLALVRGRLQAEPELRSLGFSTSPGQSLFLAFLACALASTATGLSCTSPARVEPARSSWDFGAGEERHSAAFCQYAFSSRRRRRGAPEAYDDDDDDASSAGSGHVHWSQAPGDTPAPAPEEQEEGPPQEPPAAEAGGRGWLQRYCDSAWRLLGDLAWNLGPGAAPPTPPEEGDRQQEGSSRWTDV